MSDKPTIDRREFLRRGLHKVTEQVMDAAESRVVERARHWIRPPYAIPELEFLLACTRCDACREACPHQVIFPLPARLGMDVAATPALDLLNRGCHLCVDWPCVTVCEPHALRHPEPTDDLPVPLPRFAQMTIDVNQCLPYLGPECGACEGVCPVPGALVWERERPVIDMAICAGCGLCREACILEPKAIHLNVRVDVTTDVKSSAE